MADNAKFIVTCDCLPFETDEVTTDIIQKFIQTQSGNIFWFSSEFHPDDDSKLAEFDYRNNYWRAGRFVGEAMFSHNKTDYTITIKPRFGENFLFRMLEEIFNIRITTSASQNSKGFEWQHYIKRIIAFIWIQKLANVNLHGVPKVLTQREYKGSTIKGRLNAKKSVKHLHCTDEVISSFREKQIDQNISQIIFQAHQILKNDFDIGSIKIPDSAREAIHEVTNTIHNKKHINESTYKNIKYKDIYLSWKPLVDLSWDIIKQKQFSLKQDKAVNGIGFFIDMAEIWEQYLRNILKKNLSPFGWSYRNHKQIAYKGYFFQRELKPDLVFIKGNKVVVLDAKYKQMKGRYFDVDRSDFFQIHTYIQYYLYHKSVKVGGLLYPISTIPNYEEYKSSYLINEEGIKANFIIDGIELTEQCEQINPIEKEKDFIKRIIDCIEA
jgi:5-methylcytosine-specific restriction endonuclease McrBC regulatory subunit McrC